MPGSDEAALRARIQELLPARLTISELKGNIKRRTATGTMKIYCSSDNKTFLSDFEAELGEDGKVTEFKMDGLELKGFRFCEET